MASNLYAGSTTPFDPTRWSGGNLQVLEGTGVVLERNSIWLPDTQSSPATAITFDNPADGDVFRVKCDAFTNLTNKITVTSVGGDTIDGDTTFEITTAQAWSEHRYDADNKNWALIGGYSG